MSRAPRRLLSFRRPVEATRVEAYDRIWSELRDAAVANDTHAWRFAGVKDASIRLEFLEFAEHSDPRTLLSIRQLLSRLEREIGPAEEEEWAER